MQGPALDIMGLSQLLGSCFASQVGGSDALGLHEQQINCGELSESQPAGCHGKQDVQSLQDEVQRLQQELTKLR